MQRKELSEARRRMEHGEKLAKSQKIALLQALCKDCALSSSAKSAEINAAFEELEMKHEYGFPWDEMNLLEDDNSEGTHDDDQSGESDGGDYNSNAGSIDLDIFEVGSGADGELCEFEDFFQGPDFS
jgi:hypothetical protein